MPGSSAAALLATYLRSLCVDYLTATRAMSSAPPPPPPHSLSADSGCSDCCCCSADEYTCSLGSASSASDWWVSTQRTDGTSKFYLLKPRPLPASSRSTKGAQSSPPVPPAQDGHVQSQAPTASSSSPAAPCPIPRRQSLHRRQRSSLDWGQHDRRASFPHLAQSLHGDSSCCSSCGSLTTPPPPPTPALSPIAGSALSLDPTSSAEPNPWAASLPPLDTAPMHIVATEPNALQELPVHGDKPALTLLTAWPPSSAPSSAAASPLLSPAIADSAPPPLTLSFQHTRVSPSPVPPSPRSSTLFGRAAADRTPVQQSNRGYLASSCAAVAMDVACNSHRRPSVLSLD